MTFQSHCIKNGIELLRDDIIFIKKQLAGIPEHLQKPVLTEYCEIWLKGMKETDIVYRQQNIGRRKANLYLLEQVHG